MTGTIQPEKDSISELAHRIVSARNPTLFPGPLVLWKHGKGSGEMSRSVARLLKVSGMKAIPMADYRPKYPKIDPETEINPNHPNLTIWHNRIDLCVFVGVHCHYANIALKIIRGGTDCYTVALCSYAGDDEAHLTIRELSPQTVDRISDAVAALRNGNR